MYRIKKMESKNNLIQNIKKIISSIIGIFLLLIIFFNFTLIIESFIMPNKTPDFFGIKTFTIVSGSMQPNINIDDVIIVREVNENEINVNDVVTFVQDGTTITHRIVTITKNNGVTKYTTKGDNNNVEDKNQIEYSQIEGKLLFKIGKLGGLLKFLQNKITLTFLICLFVISCLYKHEMNIRKSVREEKKQEYEESKKK